jgi:3-methyl-2-oxobutanoate hydroxymethyltransferase
LKLVEEAKILQDAGCFSIVLEAMPEPVATYITEQLDIPTIGIGAGPNCSGQVLVQQDMLGMFDKFVPKFCKLYANLNDQVTSAISEYVKEVKSVSFPQKQHTYEMDERELKLFHEKVKDNQ